MWPQRFLLRLRQTWYGNVNMSEGEVLVLVICGMAALISWGKWYWETAAVTTLGAQAEERLLLYFLPLFCAGILLSVLRRFAASDVRDDITYFTFYMVMGAAWVGWSGIVWERLGISARDDAVERHNVAASYSVGGALAGLTLCFAGANIGDGPGWWVVIFCALLSTAAWFLLWLLLAEWSDAVDGVTVERDTATGLRLAGFFIANGLVLGRAVAGDWHSVEATVHDFLNLGWPAAVLTAGAICLEWFLSPSRENPKPFVLSHGALPALVYLAVAVLYVATRGTW